MSNESSPEGGLLASATQQPELLTKLIRQNK
jgi:hypothetical protein